MGSMKYKINISPAAQKDLLEIKVYVQFELENPTAAKSVVGKITKSIATLGSHPYLGARLSAIANVESDYRYLVCGNYMVFYRVYSQNVYVDRVLYGRRDYMRILFGGDHTESFDQ